MKVKAVSYTSDGRGAIVEFNLKDELTHIGPYEIGTVRYVKDGREYEACTLMSPSAKYTLEELRADAIQFGTGVDVGTCWGSDEDPGQ